MDDISREYANGIAVLLIQQQVIGPEGVMPRHRLSPIIEEAENWEMAFSPLETN